MDFHIRRLHPKLKGVEVVFHYPVPDTVNGAGISWRDALVMDADPDTGVTSVLPNISAEELTLLQSGALFEFSGMVKFSSTQMMNAARLEEIKQAYTSMELEIFTRFKVKLDFMGFEGNV